MANGDDITQMNDTVPQFRVSVPLWHRIRCVLGYHKWEDRIGPPTPRRNYPIKLRRQCGRCDTLEGF